jgi:hypothetical protein
VADHGTRTRYVHGPCECGGVTCARPHEHHGCRCTFCSDANTEYQRTAVAAGRGRPPYQPRPTQEGPTHA